MSTYCWADVELVGLTAKGQKDAIAYMRRRNSELKDLSNTYLPFNKIKKIPAGGVYFYSEGNHGVHEEEIENLAKHLKAFGHSFSLCGVPWAEMDGINIDSEEMD